MSKRPTFSDDVLTILEWVMKGAVTLDDVKQNIDQALYGNKP